MEDLQDLLDHTIAATSRTTPLRWPSRERLHHAAAATVEEYGPRSVFTALGIATLAEPSAADAAQALADAVWAEVVG